MKRLKTIMLTVLITLSIFTVAFATDGKLTKEELFAKWTEDGYPDDVGGVYYDDAQDKTVITLIDPSDGRIDEIRSLVTDPETLAFDQGKYSYNDLLAVQREIEKEMATQSDKPSIHSVGIGWISIDGKVTGFGESGKEFRVVVSVDESVFSEFAAKYKEKYGDMIYVESSTGITTDDVAKEKANHETWMLVTIILFCLGIFGVFILNRRGSIFSMQTADGDTIDSTRPMNRKEVIATIRDSKMEPSDRVYRSIRKRIQG